MVKELLDEAAKDVGIDQCGDLVAELELFQDLLDVRREAVEVGLEVRLELLCLGTGAQVSQGKGRVVVEGLAGRLAEGCGLAGDPASSSLFFMSSTACLVDSSTASRRRMTTMGRITSRYLPRT